MLTDADVLPQTGYIGNEGGGEEEHEAVCQSSMSSSGDGRTDEHREKAADTGTVLASKNTDVSGVDTADRNEGPYSNLNTDVSGVDTADLNKGPDSNLNTDVSGVDTADLNKGPDSNLNTDVSGVNTADRNEGPDSNSNTDVSREGPEPNGSSTNSGRRIKLAKRKNNCPYCGRLISNYSRHLVSQHPDEDDVQEYVALSGLSPKRRALKRAAVTDRIRHRGNKMYNDDIVEGRRRNSFIPARRTSRIERVIDNLTYVSCKHCLGFFKRETLYHHLNNCTEIVLSSSSTAPSPKKSRVALARHAEQLVKDNDHASQILKDEVFSKMQKDALTATVRGDSLICKFGSEFRNTHRRVKQVSYCSSQLRSLARIYLEMKSASPDGSINEFCDCIAPKHFDLLVSTVRRMCKYDAASGVTKTPSVPPRLCSSLKRCANIMKSDAIKSESLNREQTTEVVYQMNNFLHLMEKDWGAQVGTNSEASRRRRKVVKTDPLPDPDDIRTFSEYIHKLCPRYVTKLEAVPNVKNYEALAKLVIAHIITLNRRRPNETVEITTEEYRLTLDKRTDYGEDTQNALTAEEMASGKELVIFYVAGNKNLKKVPILLTKPFHLALETLLAAQEKIGVRSKFVFGRPGVMELFDGSAVLRELAHSADLKLPAAFTANALRHHAATTSQLHSRDDTYTKRLSKFMGHDLQTHEHYYEMPLPLVQKSKVGHKLLQMILPKERVPSTTNAACSTVTSAALEADEVMTSSSVLSSGPEARTSEDHHHIVPTERRRSARLRSMRADTHSPRPQSPADATLPSTSTAESNSSRPPRECETTPPPRQHCRRRRENDEEDSGEWVAADNHSTTGDDTVSSSGVSETPPRKVMRRVRWTSAEKKVVYEAFGQQFLLGTKPSRSDIKSLCEKESILNNRTLQQVVSYVHNIVTDKHHIPTPTRRKLRNMVASGRDYLSP